MNLLKKEILISCAILLLFVAVASYKLGQRNPNGVYSPDDSLRTNLYFGYDKANKCMAYWLVTTNVIAWTKLEKVK